MNSERKPGFLSKEIFTYLVLTVCSVWVLAAFVNITPRVEEDFFFSSSDPQLQQEKTVSKLFKRRDAQLVLCVQGGVNSSQYVQRIKNLCDEIGGVAGVTSVVSITHGPDNINDALKSPFWRRLLVSEDKQGTNIIVILESGDSDDTLSRVEEIAKSAGKEDFRVLVSGIPYIVKLIQRQLVRDFRIFSLLAFVIFSIVILYIFRSWFILLGALVCSLNATLWTLMSADLLNIKLGLLTANLATVVFVLTISPIVFLTYNWQHLPNLPLGAGRVGQTMRYTIVSSFWSMATTLLGFLSLLMVPAKPLRELGISGAMGTLIAFAAAYVIYPAFLRSVPQPKGQAGLIEYAQHSVYHLLNKVKSFIPLALIIVALFAIPGLKKIDKDPSLLSYFRKTGEISQGLQYIDKNGGSNPLIIVVRSRSGEKLNTTRAYKQLWSLQIALENHESVGAVLSLPVLMAQAKRRPFASFLKWEWLLSIMEGKRFGEVSKTFISEDRANGLFLLRMKEHGRKHARLDIVSQLKDTVESKGFMPEITAGTFVLQGHMSKQVMSSLIYGLASLLLIFFFINCLASGSFKVGLAMTLSFSVIPVTVLGFVGLLKVPLDIVCAPAVNVAMGLGIDSALHTVRNWRWRKKNNHPDEQNWREAKRYMWNPVVSAMLVIVLGFGVFLFSQFPPTQRFGAVIIGGAFISIFASIFLMPWLAQLGVRRLLRKGDGMGNTQRASIPTRLAYRLLYIIFVVAPIVAGLDKFFNILADWTIYLSPFAMKMVPLSAQVIMRVVGVVEIAAGIIVAVKPRIGGTIVSLWLLAIVANLLLTQGFYDIALRDLGLSLGAVSLTLLGKECCSCK
ncbi:MAG: MMPL family transporter [Candidatus Omnitrophota bacterium]